MIALLLAVSLVASGDTVAWLGSVLPDYGTFQYGMVTTKPIGYSLRRIVTVRTTPCTIVVHVTLRSPSSMSDIEDSVSLADLPSDSVTVLEETGTSVRGLPVAFRYDPPFWEVATIAPTGAQLVTMHDNKTGRTRRWPWFVLYIDTQSHANDVAAALRAAIRQCSATTREQ